jgi:hypothetical protein
MAENRNYAQDVIQIEKRSHLEGPGVDGKKKTDSFFSN